MVCYFGSPSSKRINEDLYLGRLCQSKIIFIRSKLSHKILAKITVCEMNRCILPHINLGTTKQSWDQDIDVDGDPSLQFPMLVLPSSMTAPVSFMSY